MRKRRRQHQPRQTSREGVPLGERPLLWSAGAMPSRRQRAGTGIGGAGGHGVALGEAPRGRVVVPRPHLVQGSGVVEIGASVAVGLRDLSMDRGGAPLTPRSTSSAISLDLGYLLLDRWCSTSVTRPTTRTLTMISSSAPTITRRPSVVGSRPVDRNKRLMPPIVEPAPPRATRIPLERGARLMASATPVSTRRLPITRPARPKHHIKPDSPKSRVVICRAIPSTAGYLHPRYHGNSIVGPYLGCRYRHPHPRG